MDRIACLCRRGRCHLHAPSDLGARLLEREKKPTCSNKMVTEPKLRFLRRTHSGQHRSMAHRKGDQGGFFTTVWQQDKGEWRWLTHGRHTLGKPLAARKTTLVQRASCRGKAPGPPLMATPTAKRGPGGVAPDDFGRGYSSDRTLGWDWRVGPGGVRHFRTFMWTGRSYTLALDQMIGGK